MMMMMMMMMITDTSMIGDSEIRYCRILVMIFLMPLLSGNADDARNDVDNDASI